MSEQVMGETPMIRAARVIMRECPPDLTGLALERLCAMRYVDSPETSGRACIRYARLASKRDVAREIERLETLVSSVSVRASEATLWRQDSGPRPDAMARVNDRDRMATALTIMFRVTPRRDHVALADMIGVMGDMTTGAGRPISPYRAIARERVGYQTGRYVDRETKRLREVWDRAVSAVICDGVLTYGASALASDYVPTSTARVSDVPRLRSDGECSPLVVRDGDGNVTVRALDAAESALVETSGSSDDVKPASDADLGVSTAMGAGFRELVAGVSGARGERSYKDLVTPSPRARNTVGSTGATTPDRARVSDWRGADKRPTRPATYVRPRTTSEFQPRGCVSRDLVPVTSGVCASPNCRRDARYRVSVSYGSSFGPYVALRCASHVSD